MPESWPIPFPLDQIAATVALAEPRLKDAWSHCLRCLRLAVGGEASNLSGHVSFDKPLPPVPPTFNGYEFSFTLTFPSGATVTVTMRRQQDIQTEWRPVLPYVVQTTTAGVVECREGLYAVRAAWLNGEPAARPAMQAKPRMTVANGRKTFEIREVLPAPKKKPVATPPKAGGKAAKKPGAK